MKAIRDRGGYVPVDWQTTVEEMRATSARLLRLALFTALGLFLVCTVMAILLQLRFGWPSLITWIAILAGAALGGAAATMLLAKLVLAWQGLWQVLGLSK